MINPNRSTSKILYQKINPNQVFLFSQTPPTHTHRNGDSNFNLIKEPFWKNFNKLRLIYNERIVEIEQLLPKKMNCCRTSHLIQTSIAMNESPYQPRALAIMVFLQQPIQLFTKWRSQAENPSIGCSFRLEPDPKLKEQHLLQASKSPFCTWIMNAAGLQRLH